MSRLTLLCLAVLAAVAGAEPQPLGGRKTRPAVPVDPYAPLANPTRSAVPAKDRGPVDPYAISSTAADAAYVTAANHIVELRKEALQLITARLMERQTVTEFDVMQFIVRGMAARGIVGPSPSVATGINTDNAYYVPTAQRTSPIRIGDPIVIFIAARIDNAGSAAVVSTASQTWCAVADKTVPAPIANAFETIRIARDRAVALAVQRGRGRRTAVDQLPFPSLIVGQGIYFPGSFGLRTEVSLQLGSPKPNMTPAVQTAVQTLLP